MKLNFWMSYLEIRLIKYFLLFFYFVYFITCLLYGKACYRECEVRSWMLYNRALNKLLNVANNVSNPPTNFLRNIDYTASNFLSLTSGDRYAYHISDEIVQYSVALFGYFV